MRLRFLKPACVADINLDRHLSVCVCVCCAVNRKFRRLMPSICRAYANAALHLSTSESTSYYAANTEETLRFTKFPRAPPSNASNALPAKAGSSKRRPKRFDQVREQSAFERSGTYSMSFIALRVLEIISLSSMIDGYDKGRRERRHCPLLENI